MARIIDKIKERRKELQRDSRVASQTALAGISSDTADDAHHRDGSLTSTSNAQQPPLVQPGWYYSFEFFPPKTEPGLDNLLTRIDRMCRRLDPLFVSITWGSNGSTLSRTLAVASHAQRFACVDVLLHLSCTGLTREQIGHVLAMAKSSGVHNILALRGDPPQGKRAWKEGDVSGGECDRAIDLVKLIRRLHGNYFGIGVAGHPEGHPSSQKGDNGKALEMQHLKEKLDAGADFVISQFFYDVNVFLDYVKRCRKVGIDCPIIPGIMPVQSYSSLVKMTQFCGISVPSAVMDRLSNIRLDDEAVKQVGCKIVAEMCEQILSAGLEVGVDGFHFYTLNLERSTTRILTSLGAVDIMSRSGTTPFVHETKSSNEDLIGEIICTGPNGSQTRERQGSISEQARSTRRVLPWKPSAMENRSKEDVRPINWSNRPKSYVMRTDDWDEVRRNMYVL